MFRKMRPLAITTMLVVATIYPLPSTSPRAVWAISEIDPTTTDVEDVLLAKPHVLDDAVADVLVRVLGSVCSGTPITGTVFVVSAAHCVLTPQGKAIQRTVERDGVRYRAVAVLVDTDYADHPREEIDAAVLVMAQVIPGPSVRVGSALPDSGQVTLAGFQPVDTDGSLLRGQTLHDHPLPKGATGTRTDNPRPAGCVASVRSLEVSAARVMVPCGLIPGASGGGLFTEDHGELVLVGILSTVTADLSANGIVPLASLHELLEHPDRHTHSFPDENPHRSDSRFPDVYAHSLPSEDGDVTNRPSGSGEPWLVLDGGTPERRQTVIDAANRYASVGLALPELRVHIHTGGKAGCGGFQGLFHPDGDVAVIDLCYPGEFLALHELGHAWERFNLDDRRRAEFELLTGSTTWRSTDVVWRARGAERAANVLAHGLLSTPLTTARYHERDFELFETLTGITSPRLAEIEPPDTTVASLDHEQLTRLAAYEQWRNAQTQV